MHQLLITVSLFALVQGFPWYQRSIPNGNKVPSPCETGSKIWLGVGHVEEPGGGARNSFGRVSTIFIMIKNKILLLG